MVAIRIEMIETMLSWRIYATLVFGWMETGVDETLSQKLAAAATFYVHLISSARARPWQGSVENLLSRTNILRLGNLT